MFRVVTIVTFLAAGLFAQVGHVVTSEADFASGVGTNGWERTGDTLASPTFPGTVLDVRPICTGLVAGAEVRITAASASAYAITCLNGATVPSVTTRWFNPRLRSPASVAFTPVSETSFTLQSGSVSNATAYRLTFWVGGVAVRRETNATGFFAWQDVPVAAGELTLAALSDNPDETSFESDPLAYDPWQPPAEPVLNAVPASWCLTGSVGSYVPDIPCLTNNLKTWINGVTPLAFWMGYERYPTYIEALSSLSTGTGVSQTSGFHRFVGTDADGQSIVSLGMRSKADAGMQYGFAVVNDTDRILEAFQLTLTHVQWGFRNASNTVQTVSAEWLVTNELVNVTADGDWRDIPSLAFTTPGSSARKPATGDCFTDDRSVALSDVPALYPGGYLLVRLSVPKMSSGPGTGIADFTLSFSARSAGTVLFLR